MGEEAEQHRRFERQLASALRTVLGNAARRERALVLERDEALRVAERALADVERAHADVERAQTRVDEVYASETWRVGDSVLRIPKLVRGALRRRR